MLDVGGTCLFKCCGSDYSRYTDQRVEILHQYTEEDKHNDIPDTGIMFQVRASDGTVFDAFEDELTDWRAKP